MSYIAGTYAPDLDTSWDTLPGGIQEMVNFVPTRRGTFGSWSCENALAEYTSSTEPRIGWITRKTDGTARFFLASKQAIFEFTSTSAATDRSGTTYSASTENWTFTQFGDITIAVNLLNNPQKSTVGAFSDLGGSPPKAQLVASNLGFIMLANYNDGTAYQDGWACSDIEDAEDWTVTATNQADRGRLYDTPGPIRALVPLRDTFVAYKDDSIYVGEYVGDPNTTIWAWRLIADNVGCSGMHGVCNFNDKHYFVHRSGFYVFDGAAVRQFGREVTRTIFQAATALGGGINYARVQVTADYVENTLFYAFGDSNHKLAATYTYNVETGKWGGKIEDTVFTFAGSSDYATCIVRCTQASMIAFASGLASSNPQTAVFAGPGNSGKIGAYYGTYPAAATSWASTLYFVFGPIGGERSITRLNGLDPAFRSLSTSLGTPAASVITSKSRAAAYSAVPNVSGAWNSTELRFDFSGSGVAGRYHTIKQTYTDSTEISGWYIDMLSGGKK